MDGLYALSKTVTQMKPSATAMVTDKAMALKEAGEDVIALSVGEPDFAPHDVVLAATAEAATSGRTRYTSTAGTAELRDAICEYLTTKKRTPYTRPEILISNGGKQSLIQAILAVCSPGDEVIIPTPFWVSYAAHVQMAGAELVTVRTTPESGFLLSAEQLRAALTPKTRLLVICNPSNPTGAVYPTAQLEELAAVVREHPRMLVIADEIYEKIVFEGEHTAFASLPGMKERSLTINGFSKAFAMTGYRIGYLAGPAPIVAACLKLQSQMTSGANSIGQHAALAALRGVPETFFSDAITAFRQKRDFVLAQLRAIPGVSCPTPNGAFYVFPVVEAYFGAKTPAGDVLADAVAIVLYLLEAEKVAVVPGDAFGEPRCFRISYATSIETLTEAMRRISHGLLALVRADA